MPFRDEVKHLKLAIDNIATVAAGKNALRLAPPLVVDEQDVAIALQILDQCLSELD